MHVFCFGFGYTAAALARVAATASFPTIVGTNRSGGGALLRYDGLARCTRVAEALMPVTHVLVSIPPDEEGCPALRHFASDLARAPQLSWIGYFSTVGVYGDAGGAWVDETTPLNPTSRRGHRRVVAEQAWQAFGRDSGRRVDIFRLPGIYGPGRSAIDQLRHGTAKRIVKAGQVFNRIHVDDIAGALVTAMTGQPTHRVFNITDDLPAPPQDVVVHAATLLGMEPPPETPFDAAALTEMAASFYAENKRVRNARMKADLGYALRYPTYREGLAAIAESETMQP